jgi:Na+/phosphate symporter
VRVIGSTTLTARLVTGAVATLAAALLAAGTAHADTDDDAFLNSLGSAGLSSLGTSGLGTADPADTVALGQSVCPMLAQPGQTAADAAAKVADTAGMPMGPATMFTGLAISAFCPGVMASLANGESPLPLGLFGF